MTQIDGIPETDDTNRIGDRIHLMQLNDGVVMYDIENASAWIQAEETVSVSKRA